MRFLLDTHTFLWFIAGSSDLHADARSLIEEPENQRLLSIASLWEIAIKASLGKLEIEQTLPELVTSEIEGNAIELLPIAPTHLEVLAHLRFHHRDPFDRLIIAQAMAEDIGVVTRDTAFRAYPVETLWTKGSAR